MQCKTGEFGCSNGECFPLSKRCNEISDCDDDSDETNCNLLDIQDDIYRKEYPSISKNEIITQVFVNISVVNIDKLDETGTTFSVKIQVQLKWYDSRLKFFNLHESIKRGKNVGRTERDRIWIPRLIFSNSLPEVQLLNDDLSFLMVRQESQSTLNSENEIVENRIYDGDLNPIIYEKFLDLNLRCNYEFSTYPFDQQYCNIQVDFQQFLKLVALHTHD